MTTALAASRKRRPSEHSVAGPPYLAEGEAAVIRPFGSGFEVFAKIRVEDWETFKGAAK